MSLSTARITELPSLTEGLPLNMADRLPIYISSENKTKKVSLQELNTFFNLGGGGGSHPSVTYGGELIYIVPADANDTQTAYIPSLAGKDFTLERGGIPLIALLPDNSNVDVAEYDILDAGGFQLLIAGDVLQTGERFKLSVFSLIGTGTGGGSTGVTNSSFIKGKKVLNTNTTLDPVLDVNKSIQIRAASSSIIVTIPSVDDIPANGLFLIESHINNTKPSSIKTSGGQYIYFDGVQKTEVFMHPGEVMWLLRDDDGLYVVNDFYLRYRNLCKPVASYSVDNDELLCEGQLVNRVDVPRIWEKAQTLGFSLVDDTTWNIAAIYRQGDTYYTSPPGGTYETIDRPYRGCFSTGDGTTTMRLPDLMNMALRGIKSKTGSDTERYLNKAGGFQNNQNKAHTHGLPTNIQFAGSDAGGQDGGNHYDEGHAKEFTDSHGGIEARMDNIGVLWTLKK